MSGGERVQSALVDLYLDYKLFREAQEADDKKDENNDGIADVDQVVSAHQVPLNAFVKCLHSGIIRVRTIPISAVAADFTMRASSARASPRLQSFTCR